MEYQTLEQKLEALFACVDMTTEEKKIMIASYLNPGITQRQIAHEKGTSFKTTLQGLAQQGLVFLKQNGTVLHLYPIPLALLLQQCEKRINEGCINQLTKHITMLDKWIKYPIMRSADTGVKTSENNATLIQWLFDLHATEWEKVYCFGDYESFIETIGIDTETSWIKERTKKGRKACVLATQDGKWARHIRDFSHQQLRDCLIDPTEFSDLFIMAFPEINTTVIGSSDNEVTFVHSSVIADHYSKMVEESMMTA